MITVTYNLAAVVEQKDLSLSELARRVNVSKSYIWYVTHNRTHPTLYMLVQMAAVLEVPVESLYTVTVL